MLYVRFIITRLQHSNLLLLVLFRLKSLYFTYNQLYNFYAFVVHSPLNYTIFKMNRLKVLSLIFKNSFTYLYAYIVRILMEISQNITFL